MILNSILLSIIFFILGIILGIILYKLFIDYHHIKETKRSRDAINNIFKKVLKDIKENRTSYINRLGDNISIKGSLDDVGIIEIIYISNKNDIALFSKDICIYTSGNVDRSIIDDIIDQINIKYRSKIDDIVIVMGIIYYKPEFEKKFNITVEEMKRRNQTMEEMKKNLNEQSDIDKIIQENKTKFDIDDILDKIASNGINNLTNDEKIFLKKYNN